MKLMMLTVLLNHHLKNVTMIMGNKKMKNGKNFYFFDNDDVSDNDVDNGDLPPRRRQTTWSS